MTRKLPADIPSLELRGAHRPDVIKPSWKQLKKLPRDRQVLFTDKDKRFQWTGMVAGENPPLPVYHNDGKEIEAAYWSEHG